MAAPASSMPSPARRIPRKMMLWSLLGLAVLFVLATTEYPILHDITGVNADYRLQLIKDRALLIPHALCGVTALLIGPWQFSTRMRARNLPLHRVLGRVYVYAVFLASLFAIIISWGGALTVGTDVQAGLWSFCTLAALLTARNQHIAVHRQWMIRSYAMTFTFITLRVPNVFPKFLNMSAPHFVLTIIIVSFCSAFLPDVWFNWRELTTKRA